MKKYACLFVLIATGFSTVAFANTYRCATVTSNYSYPVDGATVDPQNGIFTTFITDAGSGFELWEEEVSSLTGYDFKRKTECKENAVSRGTKIQKLFICDGQTADGAIHFQSALEFNTKLRAGSYIGQVSGANPGSFKFHFKNCVPN